MESILLRRATPDDAAAFAQFMADEEVFGQLMQLPFPDAAFWRKRLETPPDPGQADIHLVAELGGKVVGSAGLHSNTRVVRRRHAIGLGISVGKSSQGQGVGDALMRSLLEYADQWAGILRVELTVWADNDRAIRLYAKHGFEVEGRMRAYGLKSGQYADAIAMARLNPHPPEFAAPK